MNDTGPGSREGSRFGPYRLQRLLGHGTVGEVYQAEDTRNGQVVALKLISAQFSADSAFRTRMEHQAEAVGQLTEPHIVPIHAYGEIDGLLYLEMSLIDGTDLATLLEESGPLSPPRAVAIVRQVAAALDAAHQADVAHRDVKPETILVTADDFAYLSGVAGAAFDPETETGTPAGGYAYLAPERLTGDEITAAADVFALAAVLAECLTGSPPYRADSVEEAIDARRNTPPPLPSKLRPGKVPAALDDVVARGLATEPEQRYRSAGDLAVAAYRALTEAEQRQVTRILRRGATAPLPAAETTGQGLDSAAAAAPRRSWTPPDEGRRGTALAARGPRARPEARAADRSPTDGASRRRWRRLTGKPALVGAVVAVAVSLAVIAGYLGTRSAAVSPVAAPRQTVLQFDGLDYRLSPGGVALGSDGSVYVSSEGMQGRVVRLAAGSSTPVEVPFTDLYQPRGLVVDDAGTVYFSDGADRVVKVVAGANSQTVLPFVGLDGPDGVAVDSAGAVFVADRGNDQVLRLDAGSSTPAVLPFVGLNGPDGVAVDHAGNVYVTDTGNNRVLKLVAGSNEQVVLPFNGIIAPWGIAVGDDGSVYVTEHNRNKVVKLPGGAAIPVIVPFTGLNAPSDVAVDGHGNVYVADRGNDRVVKVAAG